MTILDSSVWIAFFNRDDSQRNRARKLFPYLNTKEIIILDHIYAEIMNVLRQKSGNNQCIRFKKFLSIFGIQIVLTTRDVMSMANKYFFKFKKLSFTDCLILSSSKINDYNLITFDNALEKAAMSTLTKK